MVQSLPQSDGSRILFNSPELSEVQRSGFHLFLKKGIAEELSKISCIQLKHVQFLIEIVIDAKNFRLVTPENNYRDCILKMKSYTCKLYVQTKILFKDKVSGELVYQTQPEWVLLADLPMMTKRGHFVINGSPRVIVHQVGRAPGVYFKKVLKVKKDVNNKARFYGDIIPRKGVWVRLQINKKGDIDLKLKKSKKVRAEMVQKCLELLEQERSKPILFERHKMITNLKQETQNYLPVLSYRFKLSMDQLSLNLQNHSGMLKRYAVAPLIHAPKQDLSIKSVSPFSCKNEPFYNGNIFFKSNYTKNSFAFTQKQLFFSVKNVYLAGIDRNNCFYSQTRQTQAFVIGLSINKPKTVTSSIWYHARPWLRKKTQLVHNPNGSRRFELLRNNRLAKTSLSFQSKRNNHNLVSTFQEQRVGLVERSSLPLGAQMYGKKRSGFTKAEKEAFTNVYTSFYKNSIQDIKERASMSFGKKVQDLRKPDSLNSSLPSITRVAAQSKSGARKPSVCTTKLSPTGTQRVEKKKSAKKQNISIHLEKVRDYLYQLFKRSDLYDLGTVGREKINTKFGISVIEPQLTALDIKETINWLSKLRAGKEEIDDIDHSQNRRVRTSSELIQTQFEIGITRLKNVITKKVRNGRIEQIKTLPFILQTKDLQEQSLSVQNQPQFIRVPKQSLCVPSFALQDQQTENVEGLENKLIKTTTSSGSHFRGGGSCFVRRNTFIDKLKYYLQNRTTFTSINPYCITHQKKKKYYSTLVAKTKVSRCLFFPYGKQTKPSFGFFLFEDLGKQEKVNKLYRGVKAKLYVLANRRFAQRSFYKHELKFARKGLHLIHAKVLERKSFSIDTENTSVQTKFMSNTQPSCTFSNTFFAENQIKESVSIDVTTQDVFNPQNHHQLSNFSVSELFSTKPINGALREFFSSSPLSQYMDQTNPLAEITHKRRISSLGVGGVSRESAGMAIRGIHPTHYGRICPIETPEGKNAGLVNSLAFYAKINNQGFIETPYYKVIKGQIQHELGFSFVSAGQESQNGLYIAPNDIKQSKSKLLAANISTLESIPVRVADTILDLFKKVSPYQVDCIGISPVQILSVATSLIPFLEHNDANRALMGSNMQRQAVSLMISERPLVGTGLEARVLAESGHLVQSKVSGFISSVSAHKVVVERLFHDQTVVPTVAPSSCLMHFSQTLDKSILKHSSDLFLQDARTKHSFVNIEYLQSYALYIWQRISSVRTQNDIKRSLCVQSSALHNEAFGRKHVSTLFEVGDSQKPLSVPSFSTSCAYARAKLRFARKTKQWSVKESSIDKDKPLPYLSVFRSEQDNGVTETFASSRQTNKSLPFSFTKKKFALLPVTHSISTFSRSNQETCLVQKPLVEEGDWVQKGDMLSDCSAGQKGELSVGKNMFIAYIPWQGYNFEDAIVISDRLVKEQLYTSLHIERYTVIVNDFKDKVVDTNEWFTGNLPGVDINKRNHLQKSGLPVIGTILREGDILVGKIKYSKKKPATPHEKLVCDILGEHNFSVQNSSLYVPKGVHEARVLTYKIKKRFEKALKNNCRPAGAPKVVHIFLGEKRNIQVGDKMSGRHGNKGIVSTILPKQDMPYLADGSPIDILLNPLGVPSRMNVGQVFECLLGLASTYLHQNFKVTSFDELYGVEASQSLVFLKLYQARLQSGQNWLFQVNFPGKTRLTDGRSGECLDQWITVGRAYMLKLIHMVNEKIHARAIGPYALVTQQPLKGRAHKGGQRLGEMEVWAVEGFGAAYILQELLTKKSDDSIGRKEVLKAMLPRSASFLDFFDPFGQPIQTDARFGSNNVSRKEKRLYNENMQSEALHSFNVLGQPDIFKVLICELQALCLDVGVYSMRTESFQRQFLGILE